MDGWVVFLDPTVVAPPEQRPLAVEKRGADGDATLGQTKPGFLQRNAEHRL